MGLESILDFFDLGQVDPEIDDLFGGFDPGAFDSGAGLPVDPSSFDFSSFVPTDQDLQLFPGPALSLGVPGIDDRPLESVTALPGTPLSLDVSGIDDTPLSQQFLSFGDQGPLVGPASATPRLSFFGDQGIPPLRLESPPPSALSRILDAVGRGAEGALRASGQGDGGRGGGFFLSAPPHPDVIGPLPPTPSVEAPTPIPFQTPALSAEPPPQGLAQLAPDFFPETRAQLPKRLSLQDLLGR